MKSLSRQDGMGLIMLLGLMAALAIGAAGVVVLLGNSLGFTFRAQGNTKAFNVAEGALNVGMATLQKAWPASPTPTPTFPTSTFRAQYPTRTFSDPSSGSFITVSFFDNSANSGQTTISPGTSPGWDSSGDNEMYIRATARVGTGQATVQGLVQRTFFNPSLPVGIAVYSGGTISSNSQGGGSMPKVLNDYAPPPVNGGLATVYAAGGYTPSGLMQAGTLNVVTNGVPPIDSIITPTMVAAITQEAIAGGRYFTGANAIANAENSTQSAMGGPGLLGLTVIVPPSGATGPAIPLPGQGTSDATPALLFVLGDSTTSVGFTQGGSTNSYGYFYTRYGPFDFAHGTPTVYGTCICGGDVGFLGTPQIVYDNNIATSLAGLWPANVKLVPNTWRELSPGATN